MIFVNSIGFTLQTAYLLWFYLYTSQRVKRGDKDLQLLRFILSPSLIHSLHPNPNPNHSKKGDHHPVAAPPPQHPHQPAPLHRLRPRTGSPRCASGLPLLAPLLCLSAGERLRGRANSLHGQVALCPHLFLLCRLLALVQLRLPPGEFLRHAAQWHWRATLGPPIEPLCALPGQSWQDSGKSLDLLFLLWL